jgi:predicted ATPase
MEEIEMVLEPDSGKAESARIIQCSHYPSAFFFRGESLYKDITFIRHE